MARTSLTAAAMVALAITELPAQRAPEPLVTRQSAHLPLAAGARSPISRQTVASAGRPVAGALLGGAVGMVAGGLAGLYIGGNRCRTPGASDTCEGLLGMALGAGVGITLGVPVGAHLLNRRQGSLPPSLLASAAIFGVGVAAILAVERSEDEARRRGDYSQRNGIQVPIALAIPVLQVVSATIIETRTASRGQAR